MREQKEKIKVPAYKMGLAELYLLLRIRMEQTGRKNQRSEERISGARDLSKS